MTDVRSAAIIGLGMMGGSLARDLAAAGVEVHGWDAAAEALESAAAAGVVHQPLPDTLEGAGDTDLLVLAVPVRAAPHVLELVAPALSPHSVVTDLGSSKRSITRAAEALGLGDRFVGSHPLAGSHRSGWAASRTGLFAGAQVFVCPTPTAASKAVDRVRRLWESLGGRPRVLDAASHDRLMAWVSHLPQAVSSVLAAVLDREGLSPDDLGPGGREMTRLAGSSPGMWEDLLLDNADEAVPTIERMEATLLELREALAAADAPRLRQLLDAAWRWSGGGSAPPD